MPTRRLALPCRIGVDVEAPGHRQHEKSSPLEPDLFAPCEQCGGRELVDPSLCGLRIELGPNERSRTRSVVIYAHHDGSALRVREADRRICQDLLGLTC